MTDAALARMLRQTDRQTDVRQSQWIPQGLNVARTEEKKPKPTDIAAPLNARDYKGVRGRDYSTVVYYEKNKSKQCD